MSFIATVCLFAAIMTFSFPSKEKTLHIYSNAFYSHSRVLEAASLISFKRRGRFWEFSILSSNVCDLSEHAMCTWNFSWRFNWVGFHDDVIYIGCIYRVSELRSNRKKYADYNDSQWEEKLWLCLWKEQRERCMKQVFCKVALLLVDLRFFISSWLRSYTAADIWRQIYLYRAFQK